MALDKTKLLNKVLKPKTHRGKKFIQSREPKLIEDTKKAIFLKGTTANDYCTKLMKDLYAIKKPDAIFFDKKKDWRPFEDCTNLEFFCTKNDSSLFAFASHSKKRPNNLILGRTYDGQVLDMIEFEAQNYVPLSEFKIPKMSVGTKPIIIFSGEQFDIEFDYQRIKSLLLDFFTGNKTDAIRLSGLEYLIQFIAVDGKIFMRNYRLLFKKSGTRVPRIEVEEIGPRVDFVLRRTKLASEDLFKRATKQPKELKKKKVKNIKKDEFGSTMGRIHMERQDYNKLQVKKLKGLKKDGKVKKNKRSFQSSIGEQTNDIQMEENGDNNNNDVESQQKKKVRFSL